MRFLEKLKSRRLSKLMAAAVVGGSLFFGGSDALAAGANSNEMMMFREAYLSVPPDNRSFDQMISFFGGTVFKADITAESQILRDASIRIKGVANWTYTSPSTKQTTNFNIPFYIAQNGNNDITMYVQRNRRWSKIILPGFPSALANAFKTNDMTVMQENMKAVKDVEIFKDDATQRIMRVVVDGDYVSGLLEKYDDQSSDAAIINRNLKKAFTDNDVLITWTVDKNKNKTVTVVVELTDLMRSYARGLLEDSAAGKVKLNQEEMALLDSIGYYSEFHYSLSYNSGIGDLNLPANAANAPENENALDDLERDMVAVVKK